MNFANNLSPPETSGRRCGDSCTGVDIWAFLRLLEANFHSGFAMEDVAVSKPNDNDCREKVPSKRQLRHMARSPRLHGDDSVAGMAHQWNALSDGPLTQRMQSIDDWQHLWTGGLAENAQGTCLDGQHLLPSARNKVQRTPTMDEQLAWFTQRYGIGDSNHVGHGHEQECLGMPWEGRSDLQSLGVH